MRFRAIATAGCLATFFLEGTPAEQPFIPASDSEVLETVRSTGSNSADQELQRLRADVAEKPNDPATATRLARKLIQRGRAEADPRFFSRAKAVLNPWWTNANPPIEVLLARGIIRQNQHDFDGAIEDMNAVLALNPREVEAWLVKATLHTVKGDFSEAKRACLVLPRLADELTVMAATAQVAGVSGEAARSYELLSRIIEQSKDAGAEVRQWAFVILADLAARLGRPRDAEKHLRSALQLKPGDPYTLGAYADLLLDQNRPQEVIDLLWQYLRIDALLLRVAEAEAASPRFDRDQLIRHVTLLESRYDAARKRGDTIHQREEARLRLRLAHDPATAHGLAKANWKVQREPADVRLLLETSRATGDAATANDLLRWISTNRYEDVTLGKLK